MRPYLMLADRDEALADVIEGVIRRQFYCINRDPYANAFNETDNGNCYMHDRTDMKRILWERKYELDSLCFPIQLSWMFWKISSRTSHFTGEWRTAIDKIMTVLETEQYHESRSDYRFQRPEHPFPDTLSRDGKGALVKEGIGLVWSGFRPSDDACTYGYLIPSNMLLSVVMEYLAEIADQIYHDSELSSRALQLSRQVRSAIEKEGVIDFYGDKFYAYEIDGFGQYLLMDDSNLPSLLAAPYIGYCSTDHPIYRSTKNAILSERNPYYYSGKCLTGIGSPHTPAGYVWDISLAMQGLVCNDPEEKLRKINEMTAHDAGTGYMHESINCNDSSDYTRSWFSWANAMYCELVLDYLGISLNPRP
jgi:meiotically up-regulated gene 157 (Mug157) protein